jgi:hypothetical protein
VEGVRTLLQAALACAVTLTLGLGAPAKAAPTGLPSYDQMRASLLTAADLPEQMKPDESGEGAGDSDFAVWDRCTDDIVSSGDVRHVYAGYTTGKPDENVAMFLGGPGAEAAQGVVAALLDELKRCSGPEGVALAAREHPRFGDASVFVEDRLVVIAQGDVLMYFSSRLDRATFLKLARAQAKKLANHFPSKPVR